MRSLERRVPVFTFASPRVHFDEFTPEAADRACSRPLSRGSRIAIATLAGLFLLSGSGFVAPTPVVRVNRLFIQAQVSCTPEGRLRLPREFDLLAALPGKRTSRQDHEKLIRFQILKSETTALWINRQDLVLIEGDVETVARERNSAQREGTLPNRIEWSIGSVDWSKVHCPQTEVGGRLQKFNVTLPVGMDPSYRLTLERRLGFTCRRTWGSGPQDSRWVRPSADVLSVALISAPPGMKKGAPLRLESQNARDFESWSACRASGS